MVLPVVLRNQTCVYCGDEFRAKTSATKEHVIGRRFVPKGSLHQEWNLIANACPPCNSAKADLEDDISAITMYPRLNAGGSQQSVCDGERKSQKSRSRETGKLVKDSESRTKLLYDLGPGAKLEFGLVAPPQVSPHRLDLLAQFHVRAIFYLMTYSTKLRTGRFWVGDFGVATSGRSTDWGNSRFLSFMTDTRDWHHRARIVSARDHFKLTIRKHAGGSSIWAWGVEWNKSYRSAGYFGEAPLVARQLGELPTLKGAILSRDGERTLTIRAEQSLADKNDTLFAL